MQRNNLQEYKAEYYDSLAMDKTKRIEPNVLKNYNKNKQKAQLRAIGWLDPDVVKLLEQHIDSHGDIVLVNDILRNALA